MSLRSKPPLAIHLEQILLLLMPRAAARGRPRPYRSYQYFVSLRSKPPLAIHLEQILLLLMPRAAARGRPRPHLCLQCRMDAGWARPLFILDFASNVFNDLREVLRDGSRIHKG